MQLQHSPTAEELLGGGAVVGRHLPEALLDHRAERSHAAGAARAFTSMATGALLALPELDDEDATRAARHGSDTMVLVRAEHDRVAGVHKSGLVAGVADKLACEIRP